MKLATLALALVVATTGTISTASACRMKRPRLTQIVAKNVMKQADEAAKAGEGKKAIRLYERAMNNSRDSKLRAQAAFKAAQMHASAGNSARAISRMRRAVRFDHSSQKALLALIPMLVEAGDTAGAADMVEDALGRKLGAADQAKLKGLLANLTKPGTQAVAARM